MRVAPKKVPWLNGNAINNTLGILGRFIFHLLQHYYTHTKYIEYELP